VYVYKGGAKGNIEENILFINFIYSNCGGGERFQKNSIGIKYGILEW